MGLDQNFMAVAKDGGDDVEIYYFRKVARLEMFFADKWFKENPEEREFNMEEYIVSAEDLDELESLISKGDLEWGGGFFFGNEPVGEALEHENECILEAVSMVRKALNNGTEVYYTSFW